MLQYCAFGFLSLLIWPKTDEVGYFLNNLIFKSTFVISVYRWSRASGDRVFGAACPKKGSDAAYTICSELFSDGLTYLLRSLFFAATSSRSANSHIFGLLGNCPPCLIGSDNSYHFCEKLLSYHKGIFSNIAYSFSSRSANSHIFGLLGSSRSCLIGSDNSYRFCEELLSYHKGIFPTITYSFFIRPYNWIMLWWETLNIVKIYFPAVKHG